MQTLLQLIGMLRATFNNVKFARSLGSSWRVLFGQLVFTFRKPSNWRQPVRSLYYAFWA